MSLQDAKVLFRARFGAMQPQVTLADSAVLMQFCYALLADGEDSRDLIVGAALQQFVATADLAGLKAIADDLNVPYPKGIAAQGVYQISIPQPVNQTVVLAGGSLVSTPGDGITTIPQMYRLAAVATIAPGALASGTGQVETVAVTGSPTGGTFTLAHAGQATAPLAYNATAAAVQAALAALSTVCTNAATALPNVQVTGSVGGPYTVTWAGALSGLTFAPFAAAASLTGGTAPGVSSVVATAV